MTRFLLDTDIPSETVKRKPKKRVRDWIDAQIASDLFLSVISIGELLELEYWLNHEIIPYFEGRILPVSLEIASRLGLLEGQQKLIGRTRKPPDGLIAATALEHNMTLVTRNVRDFEGLGLTIINPWQT